MDWKQRMEPESGLWGFVAMPTEMAQGAYNGKPTTTKDGNADVRMDAHMMGMLTKMMPRVWVKASGIEDATKKAILAFHLGDLVPNKSTMLICEPDVEKSPGHLPEKVRAEVLRALNKRVKDTEGRPALVVGAFACPIPIRGKQGGLIRDPVCAGDYAAAAGWSSLYLDGIALPIPKDDPQAIEDMGWTGIERPSADETADLLRVAGQSILNDAMAATLDGGFHSSRTKPGLCDLADPDEPKADEPKADEPKADEPEGYEPEGEQEG